MSNIQTNLDAPLKSVRSSIGRRRSVSSMFSFQELFENSTKTDISAKRSQWLTYSKQMVQQQSIKNVRIATRASYFPGCGSCCSSQL